MAFQNVIMPKLKLVHGASKQVVDPVMVVGNGSRETRRKQNRYERFVWQFPTRSILSSTKEELYQFFRSVDMSLHSFLFVDPDRPTLINAGLKYKSGINWYFEVDGHPVMNPDMDNLTFSVNGVGVAAAFIGYDNGRPLLEIDTTPGANVRVSGPLYMTARLASPITWSISAMDKSPPDATCSPTPLIVDLSDLTIIEVFEHA